MPRGDFGISSLFILLNVGVFIASVALLMQFWSFRRLKAIQYLLVFTVAFCLGSFFSLNVYAASTFEAKVWFSRLRFLGFAFIAPAGILFFSYVLNQWKWLHRPLVRTLVFLPGIGTALITVGVFDQNLLVFDHKPFEHLGVSVLTFENGPWFPVHYFWSNFLTALSIIMFAHSAVAEPERRKDIFILSFGVIFAGLFDLLSVATNSQSRWLMISAGTFSITELAILYVAKKNDLFGFLTFEKMKQARLLENLDFHKKLLTLMAHDLSGNIRQQARIAESLKKRFQENHHEILDTLAISSKASDDLIGNIMRWVKSQDGHFKPQKTPVEIYELFYGCTEAIQASFNDRRIEVHIEAPTKPFYVNCDAEMMASVFRNLLSNAARASSGSSAIRLKVSEHGSLTRFILQDQGCGMSSEQLKSLWDAPGKKSKVEGSGYGVGLLLTRHFVELHQGKLEVISVRDQGTQVQFTVPR